MGAAGSTSGKGYKQNGRSVIPDSGDAASWNRQQGDSSMKELQRVPSSSQLSNPASLAASNEDTSVNDNSPDDGSRNEETVNILFELIPYYRRGDESTDQIVRTAIRNLAPHEIDSCDADGNTLLLVAVQYVIEEFVSILLLKGADPNCLNHAGACALHFSCYRETQSKEITKMLLNAGADPNVAESTYGCTPLHYCAGNGDEEYCRLLLEKGADVSAYDYYQYTCADYAREAGLEEIADLLERKLLEVITARPMPVSQHIHIPTSEATLPHMSQMDSINITDEAASLPLSQTAENSLFSPVAHPEPHAFQWHNHSATQPVMEEATSIASDMPTGAVQPYTEPDITANDRALDPGLLHSIKSEQSLKPSISPRVSTMHSTGKDLISKMSTESMQVELVQKAIVDQRLKLEQEAAEDRKQHANQIAEKQGQIAKLEAELQQHVSEMERLANTFDEDRSQLLCQLQHYEEVEQRLMQQIETLQTELDAAKAQLVGANTKNESLLASVEGLKSHLEITESERADLQRKEAEDRAQREQDRQQQHQIELAELRAKQIAEIQSAKSNAEAEKRQLQEKAAKDIANLEKELEQSNKQAAEIRGVLTEAMTKLELAIREAECRAEEADRRRQAAEDMLMAAREDVERARQLEQANAQLYRDLQREQTKRKQLHNTIEDMKGKIRVYVRLRPLSQSENNQGCAESCFKENKLSVAVEAENPSQRKVWEFDQVFAGASDENTQLSVFRDTKHLMVSVLDGYNVCIFAYGQTGSGKTYTMIGPVDVARCIHEDGSIEDQAGIAPRAVQELFRLLEDRSAQNVSEVKISMFQLYRDALQDLLAPKKSRDDQKSKALKITLAEHSPTGLVHVESATELSATNANELAAIISRGSKQRTTSSTQMNADSSRSHLICSIVVKQTNRRTGSETVGKLTLVDLAGSERVDKSGAVGDQLKEAQSINLSLSAIGDVINALTSGAAHVPYRNHPLTMLMSDSIGGNSKTLMFVCCSPADYNVTESIGSLSFGHRCKEVTNRDGAGNAQQLAQLHALKKELAKLKKQAGNKKTPGLARPI